MPHGLCEGAHLPCASHIRLLSCYLFITGGSGGCQRRRQNKANGLETAFSSQLCLFAELSAKVGLNEELMKAVLYRWVVSMDPIFAVSFIKQN